MKKSFFSVLQVLLVIILITGCSTGNSSNKNSETNKQVELVFVTLTGRDNDGYNEVIKEFEKNNPNIKVKLEMYPYRQLLETIEVKMGSQSKDIDILSVDAPLVANYTVKNFLEPLDSYFPGIKFQDKWLKTSVNAGMYNNKLMAAPINSSSQVLYYNKDIFKERGVTPPDFETDKRWTWEQVVDAAKKLTFNKTGDKQPDIFGFSFEQVDRPYQLLALPESLGAKVIGANGIVATGYTNSPQMVEAGKFYFDLFNTWKVSPKISADLSVEYFKMGKLAMFIGGPYNASKFQDAKLNFGIAPHPYFAGKQVATPTGSWHAGIAKYSAHKEAAAKFIEFLTMGEGAKIWNDKHHDVPANLEVLNSLDKDAKYNNFPDNVMRIVSYEARNTGVPRPSSPGYLEWESVLSKAFEDMKNGADPKATLDTSSKQIDSLFKKYESLVK